jgi:hypothetical protein
MTRSNKLTIWGERERVYVRTPLTQSQDIPTYFSNSRRLHLGPHLQLLAVRRHCDTE